MTKIAPSVLSCDFSKMGDEIIKIDKAGADYIHIDVMDGHFVPNISFGAPVIKCVRKSTEKIFDCHLMISDPLKYIDDFIKAGADIINFHIESDSPVDETIEKIISGGCKCALTIKPGTPVETVFPYLDRLYMVLIMTVEPGFGGQKFMPEMMEKVKILKKKIIEENLNVLIEVDGGINTETAVTAVKSGADILVAGSAVFNAENTGKIIEKLRIKNN